MTDEYIIMNKNDIPDDKLLKHSYFDKLKNTDIGSNLECKLTINEILILNFSNMNINEQIDKYMLNPNYFKYYSSCILMDLKIRQDIKCLNFDKIKSDENIFFQFFVTLLNDIDDQQIKIDFYKKYVSQIHNFYFDKIFDLSIDEIHINQIIGFSDDLGNKPLIYNFIKSNKIISKKLITTYVDQCKEIQDIDISDTILMMAFEYQMDEIAEILIANNSYDPEQINFNFDTMLMMACKSGMNKTAKILITTYGDLCKPGQINSDSNTALMLACGCKMIDIAKLLITTFGNDCIPEQSNNESNTALMLACANGLDHVVELLITTFGNKCKPEQINNESNTALMLACEIEEEMAELLITKFGNLCRVEQVNQNLYTALMILCENKMEDAAELLITTFGNLCKPEQKNNNLYTALDIANNYEMVDIAELLITTFDNAC
jgi:ankyrin repeat protein